MIIIEKYKGMTINITIDEIAEPTIKESEKLSSNMVLTCVSMNNAEAVIKWLKECWDEHLKCNMEGMRYATFFGGAIDDKTTKEYTDSVRIGEILNNNSYLVRNGGYKGLMEAVSKGSYNSTGYVCKTFKSIKGNDYLRKTIVADDIYDRLRYLISGSDLFIVQKGGLGTLAELFLVLDVIRKVKDKPKVILIGNFWYSVIDGLRILENGFHRSLLSDKELEMFQIINNVEELNEIIKW
jgi:uncharacterized protein (TIGR00725 family)